VSTPAEIREQLAEILGKVAPVPSASVRDTAILKDLGVDSIASVELAEGIGREFDVRLSDETVNEWRTVGDLVRTVQREQAAKANRPEPIAPPTLTDEERNGAFKQLAVFFALIGAGLGVVIGVGAAALLASSGLDGGSLPPISTPAIPTAIGTASESGSGFTAPPFRGDNESPTPSPSPRESAGPTRASLTADPTTVAPGERFELSGALPNANGGESLRIEMSEDDGTWDDFPVTASAQPDGTFRTQIYMSGSGRYLFRVRSQESDVTTPSVSVRIGN
jgi:acyl carrier protein